MTPTRIPFRPSPFRPWLTTLFVTFALAMVSSCGGEDDAAPYLEPGGCDLTPYAWLPSGDVGAVLHYEEDVLSPMHQTALDSLLPEDYDFFVPVPYSARLVRVRYTTQDRGQAVEATGMVGLPVGDGSGDERFPVVLWTHGTTGFTHACAPSAAGTDHALFIYLLTSLGYVVVAPDFIGLDGEADFDQPPPVRHAYLNIEQTAIGSLDMVRAVRAMLADEPDLTLGVRDDLILWGISQGGHAALAVELLAPYYAPLENVLATVAVVPPTDLLGLSAYAITEPNPATAALAAVMISARYWYEGAVPFAALLSSEPPWDAANALPEAMYTGCDAGDALDGATAIEHIYSGDLLASLAGSWEDAEPWSCYLRENSIATTSTPRISDSPVLVVVGQADTLVYTPVVRDDFDRLCGLGYRLEFLECAGAEHVEAAVWSLPEQVAWMEDRIAGVALDPARVCHQTAPVTCAGQP
jgi:dienelactone hydrolase